MWKPKVLRFEFQTAWEKLIIVVVHVCLVLHYWQEKKETSDKKSGTQKAFLNLKQVEMKFCKSKVDLKVAGFKRKTQDQNSI